MNQVPFPPKLEGETPKMYRVFLIWLLMDKPSVGGAYRKFLNDPDIQPSSRAFGWKEKFNWDERASRYWGAVARTNPEQLSVQGEPSIP